MEWNEKLQNIIEYVENHLQRKEEPINIDDIIIMAECSYGFFQKVFSYMNGISFSEYIRYRKMTLAGYDLKSTSLKVVEISYKYGYDSPTSFTKAFQSFHGMSPKEARNTEARLRVFPKMQISLKQEYSWKLKKMERFRLIGKSKKISLHGKNPSAQILAFWSECQKDGTFHQLISMDMNSPQGLHGIFESYDTQKNELTYSIMVKSEKELKEGFHELMIPENTWAVFDCKGAIPLSIQNGWKYLHEEWILKYPFQHADCPEIEWYSNDNFYSDKYLSQIWIPILEEK